MRSALSLVLVLVVLAACDAAIISPKQPTPDDVMRQKDPTLADLAQKYFPGDETAPAAKRMFRLTRTQLDVTTKALLPAQWTTSVTAIADSATVSVAVVVVRPSPAQIVIDHVPLSPGRVSSENVPIGTTGGPMIAGSSAPEEEDGCGSAAARTAGTPSERGLWRWNRSG